MTVFPRGLLLACLRWVDEVTPAVGSRLESGHYGSLENVVAGVTQVECSFCTFENVDY